MSTVNSKLAHGPSSLARESTARSGQLAGCDGIVKLSVAPRQLVIRESWTTKEAPMLSSCNLGCGSGVAGNVGGVGLGESGTGPGANSSSASSLASSTCKSHMGSTSASAGRASFCWARSASLSPAKLSSAMEMHAVRASEAAMAEAATTCQAKAPVLEACGPAAASAASAAGTAESAGAVLAAATAIPGCRGGQRSVCNMLMSSVNSLAPQPLDLGSAANRAKARETEAT
mmetsp:Transcript_79245/g.256524  ORF Transcript_79245/g.256524 Transcript_79245/m.256524 type:complete len:231 (-) Transcript_79245:100-792(-)